MTLATLNFADSVDPVLAFANWYTGDGSTTNIFDIKGYNNQIIYPPNMNNPAPVPEPGTIVLVGLGVVLLMYSRPWRRVRRS
jgi:hypothetical protein